MCYQTARNRMIHTYLSAEWHYILPYCYYVWLLMAKKNNNQGMRPPAWLARYPPLMLLFPGSYHFICGFFCLTVLSFTCNDDYYSRPSNNLNMYSTSRIKCESSVHTGLLKQSLCSPMLQLQNPLRLFPHNKNNNLPDWASMTTHYYWWASTTYLGSSDRGFSSFELLEVGLALCIGLKWFDGQQGFVWRMNSPLSLNH